MLRQQSVARTVGSDPLNHGLLSVVPEKFSFPDRIPFSSADNNCKRPPLSAAVDLLHIGRKDSEMHGWLGNIAFLI